MIIYNLNSDKTFYFRIIGFDGSNENQILDWYNKKCIDDKLPIRAKGSIDENGDYRVEINGNIRLFNKDIFRVIEVYRSLNPKKHIVNLSEDEVTMNEAIIKQIWTQDMIKENLSPITDIDIIKLFDNAGF